MPIREGFARQLTKTVLGIYKPVSKVIRMAKGGLLKLGTLMHELAHHLDNTLGITGEVGHKKRAAGLTKEMEDELKTLDYDVQAFVVALENAVESDVFRRKKIGMPKTRSELLGLVEQWNKKDGIFKEATVVNEIKNVSNKIKARMSEGFAEVVRIYMTDGMQMAARDDLPPAFDITNDFLQDKVFGAPKFMKWFLEDFLAQEGAHLEVARNLSSIRGAIKKWRKSTPEARVMSIFSTTGRPVAPASLTTRTASTVGTRVTLRLSRSPAPFLPWPLTVRRFSWSELPTPSVDVRSRPNVDSPSLVEKALFSMAMRACGECLR